MSSPHRILHDIFRAPFLGEDPGVAGAIVFNKWGSVIPLVHTTGAGTRTLAAPTKAGMQVTLELESITSGEITVTVATAYDQAGSTTLEFDDAGDFVVLHSIKTGASTWVWRVLAFDGVTGPAIELQELAAETALTIDIAGTDQVKFTDGTFEPITDNDIDLGTVGNQFKNAYFAGIVEATEFFYQDLVLNSTSEINIAIGGVSLLAIDDSAITGNAGIADVDGKDVFIETQDGGVDTAVNGGQRAGNYDFKTGDGSAGGAAQVGGASGSYSVTIGDGGTPVSGTANGGDAADASWIGGAGGTAGATAGTGGNGTSMTWTAGPAGGGGAGTGTAGLPGNLTMATPLTLAQGINHQVRSEYFEDFYMVSSGSNPVPWVEDLETSVTGAEMADEPTGVYQLLTTAANQADAGQLTWGDQLLIDLDKNPIVEFRVRIDAIDLLESVEKIIFGVCQVHANAEDDAGLDNMDHSAWFMLKGDNDLNIYVEADDGSGPNDTDDQDSGIDIVDDIWIILKIDFADLSDVKFYIDNIEQTGSTVDMTSSAGQNVQPIICFQRTDASQTEAVIGIELDYFHLVQDR